VIGKMYYHHKVRCEIVGMWIDIQIVGMWIVYDTVLAQICIIGDNHCGEARDK